MYREEKQIFMNVLEQNILYLLFVLIIRNLCHCQTGEYRNKNQLIIYITFIYWHSRGIRNIFPFYSNLKHQWFNENVWHLLYHSTPSQSVNMDFVKLTQRCPAYILLYSAAIYSSLTWKSLIDDKLFRSEIL